MTLATLCRVSHATRRRLADAVPILARTSNFRSSDRARSRAALRCKPVPTPRWRRPGSGAAAEDPPRVAEAENGCQPAPATACRSSAHIATRGHLDKYFASETRAHGRTVPGFPPPGSARLAYAPHLSGSGDGRPAPIQRAPRRLFPTGYRDKISVLEPRRHSGHLPG
jgi:hypothetical protein